MQLGTFSSGFRCLDLNVWFLSYRRYDTFIFSPCFKSFLFCLSVTIWGWPKRKIRYYVIDQKKERLREKRDRETRRRGFITFISYSFSTCPISRSHTHSVMSRPIIRTRQKEENMSVWLLAILFLFYMSSVFFPCCFLFKVRCCEYVDLHEGVVNRLQEACPAKDKRERQTGGREGKLVRVPWRRIQNVCT